MMPFSVLRTWGLGLFGWVLLGLGVYLIAHWYDQTNPRPVRQADGEQVIVLTNEDAWPYLVAGVALLGLNFLGFLPVLPLLGRRGSDDPRPQRTGRPLTIDRPDGTRLHVEIYGSDSAPTLVCTHGWSLDSTLWYYAKHWLAERYRLVVWDLPGLGRSRGPDNRDYSLDKMAADLDAVVDAVAGAQPVFLVGHSIGGMINQTYCRIFASKVRQRVRGIVLIHTTYTNPLSTALGASVWKALERPLIVPLNHLTIALAPLAWLSNWQSYLNGSLHIASRITSFSGHQSWQQVEYASRLCVKAWPANVARGNLAMLAFDEQATLPKIDVPTLVIGARADRLTKFSASQHIAGQLPQGSLTAVDAGHLGVWEQHDDVLEAVAEFVQKLDDTARSPESQPSATSARAAK